MITFLQGYIEQLNPATVIINVGGIGYEVHISLNTFAALEGRKEVQLLTHYQVREDAHTLYGFFASAERDMFRLLISVSGVGASTARMILSSLNVEELQQAIASHDVALLKSVKGIGAKSAERIIIDLKDKVGSVAGDGEIFAGGSNTVKEEALSALEVLGFARKSAEKTVQAFLKAEPEMGVEDLIKNVLKKL